MNIHYLNKSNLNVHVNILQFILYSIIYMYIMETKKQIFSIASNHLKFKKPR